jgi:hypothetical protein
MINPTTTAERAGANTRTNNGDDQTTSTTQTISSGFSNCAY